MANKVVISCAVIGSIHTPGMSDALAVTPQGIARQSIDVVTAGGAILQDQTKLEHIVSGIDRGDDYATALAAKQSARGRVSSARGRIATGLKPKGRSLPLLKIASG